MTRNNSSDGGSANKQPIPWLWLGLGIIFTIFGCAAAWIFASSWLLQLPAESSGPPQPELIILTAPPSPTSAPTSPPSAPTSVPTFTPIPTPDTAVAPEAITPGYYASIANTDGLGLTIRGGPSTQNVIVTVAEEGTIVFILGGPEEAENFTWWQLRLDNGLEGWAVANYLEPAPEPG
jgi:hypothetical protein